MFIILHEAVTIYKSMQQKDQNITISKFNKGDDRLSGLKSFILYLLIGCCIMLKILGKQIIVAPHIGFQCESRHKFTEFALCQTVFFSI